MVRVSRPASSPFFSLDWCCHTLLFYIIRLRILTNTNFVFERNMSMFVWVLLYLWYSRARWKVLWRGWYVPLRKYYIDKKNKKNGVSRIYVDCGSYCFIFWNTIVLFKLSIENGRWGGGRRRTWGGQFFSLSSQNSWINLISCDIFNK